MSSFIVILIYQACSMTNKIPIKCLSNHKPIHVYIPRKNFIIVNICSLIRDIAFRKVKHPATPTHISHNTADFADILSSFYRSSNNGVDPPTGEDAALDLRGFASARFRFAHSSAILAQSDGGRCCMLTCPMGLWIGVGVDGAFHAALGVGTYCGVAMPAGMGVAVGCCMGVDIGRGVATIAGVPIIWAGVAKAWAAWYEGVMIGVMIGVATGCQTTTYN